MAAKKKKKKKGKKKDTRLDLLREQKILRAKQKVTGELDQHDSERMAWLDTELTKPPPLPADDAKPTDKKAAKSKSPEGKKSTKKAAKSKSSESKKSTEKEEEEPASGSEPSEEEEELDEKAARKKRLAEARLRDQERKRAEEVKLRAEEEEEEQRKREEEEEQRKREEEEEEQRKREEEEEQRKREEEEEQRKREEEEEEQRKREEEEEEQRKREEEEEEQRKREEEEEQRKRDEEENQPADQSTVPDWDDEETDPNMGPPGQAPADEFDDDKATVEYDLKTHGELPGAEEGEGADAVLDMSDDVPDMSDDVPDMSDDVPDMSDDVPDMSDDVPDMSDDMPDVSDDEPAPPGAGSAQDPGLSEPAGQEVEANLAPADEFDDLAGSGPVSIFHQPTDIKPTVKPSPAPAPEEPDASVMVDPTLFDDETKRGDSADVEALLRKEQARATDAGPGPDGELAAALAAAEAGIDAGGGADGDEAGMTAAEAEALADATARAEAFERVEAEAKAKKRAKKKAKAEAKAKAKAEKKAEQEKVEAEAKERLDELAAAAAEAAEKAGVDGEELAVEVQVEMEDGPPPSAQAEDPAPVPEPEPPVPPGGAFAPELSEEPDENDLDVGAALEAGAQSGVDPGDPAGLSEDALFTESVVMNLSDITGAKAITLDAASGGEDLKQNNLTGPRQAIVKMTTGLSRSGTISDPDPTADQLDLSAPGSPKGKATPIPIAKIVTVQLMLPSGLARPLPTGPRIEVLMADGLRLVGFTPDRAEGCKAFTLFPEKDRFIERVIVYVHAIKEVQEKD